jgi:hypothetical protein
MSFVLILTVSPCLYLQKFLQPIAAVLFVFAGEAKDFWVKIYWIFDINIFLGLENRIVFKDL